MNSFFQPTFWSMLIIYAEISSYRSFLYPAVSQSILFTPTMSCFTPSKLIRRECWRVWPWISPALWFPRWIAVTKFPSDGTMTSATSACAAPALLLLAIHEESEGERPLAETLSLLLQLLQLTLRQTAELEQQPPGSGGLTAVDVAADDDGQMLLLSHDAG